QLTYALLQTQVVLGMIPVSSVQQLLAKSQQPVPMGPMGAPPFIQQPPMVQPPMPGAPMGGPPSFPPRGPMPPQIPIQPGGQMPPFGQFDQLEQQRALVQQLMSLTPAQIDELPPEQRQLAQTLRQTILASGGMNQQWR